MSKQIKLSSPGQSPGFKRRLKSLAWDVAHAALWAFLMALLIDLWLHAALPCEAPVHYAVPNARARCLVTPSGTDI